MSRIKVKSPIPGDRGFDRLTLFAFVWACQALVHQEFFQRWVERGDLIGWITTISGIAVVLRPRSMFLFALMLIASVTYSFLSYPYVSNHIFAESLINVCILLAMAWTLVEYRNKRRSLHESWDTLGLVNQEAGEVFFKRFAPVLLVSFIIVYIFAFLAKLNYDFLVPQVSCAVKMYQDLVDRFSFLPGGDWINQPAIWSTILVEGSIPLLLLFRRTYPIAFSIALPFHFVLGIIGHRTFSVFAFALYFVFVSQEMTDYINQWQARLRSRFNALNRGRLWFFAKAATGVMLGSLTLAGAMGYSQEKIGPFTLSFISFMIWFAWSLAMMYLYFGTWVGKLNKKCSRETRYRYAMPGALWMFPILVTFNGLNPYLGLKTQLSFTMYSNLRTGDGKWNHIIMPSWLQIGEYQDHLVDIISTDYPELQKYIDRRQYITYFELRRVTSLAQKDFVLEYEYKGERKVFTLIDGQSNDPRLREEHPPLLAKLMRFRPVSKGAHMECSH